MQQSADDRVDPETRRALELDYAVALDVASRRWMKLAGAFNAKLGVSISNTRPLIEMNRSGDGVRQGVLAERIGVEPSSLFRVLAALEASGLVERRDDDEDRRATRLHLTPAGRKLAIEVEDVLLDFRQQALAGVSTEDIAAALRTFAAVESLVPVPGQFGVLTAAESD